MKLAKVAKVMKVVVVALFDAVGSSIIIISCGRLSAVFLCGRLRRR